MQLKNSLQNKKKQVKKERNKKDKEWRTRVLEQYNNKCFLCDKTDRLNAHHIIPREFKETRHDTLNGIALCSLHHKFGMFSAHKNPLWFFKELTKIDSIKMDYLLNKLTIIYTWSEYKK